MSPDGGDKPTGDLAAAIDDHFGSFDKFTAHFTAAAMGVQGSGWAVLTWDSIGENLIIQQFFDQQSNFAAGTVPLLAARRLGARVLPRLQERARRLRQGLLEHRQLGERARALRGRAREDRPACWYCHSGVVAAGSRPARHLQSSHRI